MAGTGIRAARRLIDASSLPPFIHMMSSCVNPVHADTQGDEAVFQADEDVIAGAFPDQQNTTPASYPSQDPAG
jgi:hypothetical protein